jgi:toxin YoeB
MQIDFSSKAKEDLNFWIKSGNKSLLNKIYSLIEDIQLHPFEGIGKPEPLKHNLSGYWSRRINQEHRIIYEIIDENTVNILSIISLKGHYE